MNYNNLFNALSRAGNVSQYLVISELSPTNGALKKMKEEDIDMEDFLNFLGGKFEEANACKYRNSTRIDYVMNGGLIQNAPNEGLQLRLLYILDIYLEKR